MDQTPTQLNVLREAVRNLGKPAWRPMLEFVVGLHERCTRPARFPFPHPWEEIGPGYCYGPAFGHIDITHQTLDVMPVELEHAHEQIVNNLAAQQDDGLVPGVIKMDTDPARWKTEKGFPPVWCVSAEDYFQATGDRAFLQVCLDALVKQIGWFDAKRRSTDGRGYYYLDVFGKIWESGVDEGIRYFDSPTDGQACVDATSHGFMMHDVASRWADRLGAPREDLRTKAQQIQQYLREDLYDADRGFFFDAWSVREPANQHITFEGFAPLITGAASQGQADRLIDDYILNPEHFFTEHPVTTVSRSDPHFELRMWRGPAWNSMTLWCARGCARYGRSDAVAALTERALDDTARQFERTGTVWEFYHPLGGKPEDVQRKPDTPFDKPCRDYLGHNPMCALARLYDEATQA